MNFRKAILILALFSPAALAQAGEFSLGAQYDGWTSDYTPTKDGTEFFFPLSVYFKANDTFSFYGQTSFANGSYEYGSTITLTDFTDSVAGTEIHFDTLGLPSLLNVGFNIPTGDQTWEEKQTFANIPTEFIDTRYRGRGFGVNGLYGLSFRLDATSQLGAGVGYLASGSYSPVGLPDLNLGDSVFLTVNRIESFGANKTSTMRLSSMFFLPSQQGGQTILQMGPNFDASYGSTDPKGFSWEIGGQFFTSAERPLTPGAPVTPEAHNSFGQRFYLAPSLALDQLTLAGLVKYITPNDYPTTDPLYDGGGILLALDPTWVAPLDAVSDLKFAAGYDFIIAGNAGVDQTDPSGPRYDVNWNYWSFGATYELKI